MAEVQAEELTVLPGAEEVVALLEVHRWAVDGRFDALLVDCAPSGETLRLLALPETIAFYADRLMGAPRRLLRTLAASLTGGALGGGSGQVHDALGDLLDRLTAARTLLTDPTHSDIRIVITAERVVIAEARRLLTALYLYGYPVGGVVVNRLLPDEVGDGLPGRPPGCRGLRAAPGERIVRRSADLSTAAGRSRAHRGAGAGRAG